MKPFQERDTGGTSACSAAGFCLRMHPVLVGTLTLYCGDRDVAEDLAQEALVRAWDRWGRVEAMASPEAWVHRVAINLANSWFRRRAAERRAQARLRHQRPPAETDTTTAVALRRAVAALPSRQRAAVVLRYFADLPVEETAKLMNCAPGTVKSLTNRAVGQLRTQALVEGVEFADG